MAGSLSGLITILVAILGYRFMLGDAPALDELFGRLVRLGFVLALVTGWPAFQTLVYRVAVDGPDQVTAVIMPAAGLSFLALEKRVQQSYDAIRLGFAENSSVAGSSSATPGPGDAGRSLSATPGTSPSQDPPVSPTMGVSAAPQTASVFVASTIGLLSALHLAIAFLLAVAPFGLIGLLFDGTIGLFNGWLRALVGSVLASLAATAVTALTVAMIENELMRWQDWRRGGMIATIDPQASSTIVYVGVVAITVAVLAGVRMGGMVGYAPPARRPAPYQHDHWYTLLRHDAPVTTDRSLTTHDRPGPVGAGRNRSSSVADALTRAARRDRPMVDGDRGPAAGAGRDRTGSSASRHDDEAHGGTAGQATIGGRRTSLRRSRLATQRDGVGR